MSPELNNKYKMMAAGIAGFAAVACESPTITVIDDQGPATINLKNGKTESTQLNQIDIDTAQNLAYKLKSPVRECIVIYTDDGADWAGGPRTKNTTVNCFPSSTYYTHFLNRRAEKTILPADDPPPVINGENIISSGGTGYGTLQTTLTAGALTLPMAAGYAAGMALRDPDKYSSSVRQEQGDAIAVVKQQPKIKEINVFNKNNR